MSLPVFIQDSFKRYFVIIQKYSKSLSKHNQKYLTQDLFNLGVISNHLLLLLLATESPYWKMIEMNLLRFVKTANSVVLDYSVDVIQLDDADFILDYGELGNFSVAGFEMTLRRHVSHYLITYYLPSGKLNLLKKKE